MDTGRAIEYLASAEALRARPFTDAADMDELDERAGAVLPAFVVRRAADGGGGGGGAGALLASPAPGREAAGHDNAERLPALCAFLNARVLPMLSADEAADVAGCTWRIELHDSYSYLPNRAGYAEALSFGRAADALERRVALVPDPYHMAGFGGALDVPDAVPWADKQPKLFFAGATTGDRDPARNARVRACAWALSRPDVACMHLTKIAQMSPQELLGACPGVAGALRAPVPVEAHWGYRYQVNIVGNTACWSRLPMLLSSGCVTVHARHADTMWYYPLLREGRHYVGADSAEGEDLLRAYSFCRSYDRQCRAMVAEANALARDLFHPGAAATYLATFLAESAAAGRA